MTAISSSDSSVEPLHNELASWVASDVPSHRKAQVRLIKTKPHPHPPKNKIPEGETAEEYFTFFTQQCELP